MRAVVQRVSRCAVRPAGEAPRSQGAGLLLYVGVERGDGESDAAYIADKTAGLRIFLDDDGKMNRSVAQAGGAITVVSQFTLAGDVRRGRRPSFTQAEDPDRANQLYERLVCLLRAAGLPVNTGVFRASMQVESCNEGPVTILLDSRRTF
ncbi:MAG: D-aminoacyl-tRNA deacylase [Spirochaetaceae bacterium]|nr:D-aminoacyl-tRNA deacylase [Spirochaetaceae bacterium]